MESAEPKSPDTGVLIVGAGPTGLTMAYEMARYGVPFRIVDRAAAPSVHSKALVVHARTLEVLTDMGCVQGFLEAGLRLGQASLYAGGQRIAQLNLDELDSPYAFVLGLPQRDTERILLDRLRERGGAVEREVVVTGLTPDDDGVSVRLRRSDGAEETLRARWVVGCDGARSTVREALGIAYEGRSREQVFLLADARLADGPDLEGLHTYFSEDGMLGVIPLADGTVRVIGDLSDGQAGMPEPTLEMVQELARRRGLEEAVLSDPVWVSSFRVATRRAAAFREGRVFVAGDAAHLHSPISGQGMNSGIQDAYNLGWKLALVEHGHARPELLDSYQAERIPVAEALLRDTDRATRLAMLRHPVARGVRDRVAGYLGSLEVVQQRLARSVAMLDLAYRDSPVVEEQYAGVRDVRLLASAETEAPSLAQSRAFAQGPRAGDRAPDGLLRVAGMEELTTLHALLPGLHHNLLLFDGRAPTAEGYRNMERIAREVLERYEGLIDVHMVLLRHTAPPELNWPGLVLLDEEDVLAARYGAEAECCYLIRPDGYVGFRSQPAVREALFTYLARIFA